MNMGFTDSFVFYNNRQKKITDIFRKDSSIQKAVYEVFRIIGAKPLFINDHLKRLEQSINKLNIEYTIPTELELNEKVNQLCIANNKLFGNIELRLEISETSQITQLLGFVTHNYPEITDYIQGINTTTLESVRENPSVKSKYTNTRNIANKILAETGEYEVLLINHQGALTEGSRSNLFFIKGNIVYTAPNNVVLSGITRLHTIELLKQMNIELVYKAIQVPDINLFDAAFICGTSPGILPIKSIDKQNFDVNYKLLRSIIVEYNQLVSKYYTNK